MTSVAKPDSFEALRVPAFRKYVSARLLFTFALLIQEVVLGYEIYKNTRDPLSLGLIGLAEAVPYIGLSLIGGYYADRLSKKAMLITGTFGIVLCSVVLFLVSQVGVIWNTQLWIMYGCLVMIGAFKAFYWPAAQAIRAFLVPKSMYANASTWNSAAWQIGSIGGPGVSGFLYVLFGLSGTLFVVILLLLAALVITFRTPDAPRMPIQKNVRTIDELMEGIRFVRRTKTILYPLSLDLFSVLFGGVVAILPIFAEDILHVGSRGLGILRAAPSIGAVVTVLLLSRFSPMRHAWRNLLVVVAGFGLATIVFALSKDFVLSVAMLLLTGAFDSVSVVIRSTILQIATPDEMRGRVSAVNGIFVSSSNELGAMESGTAAKLIGTVPSVVVGGSITLAVIAYMYVTSKELFTMKFDR